LLSRLERILGPGIAPGRIAARDDAGLEDAATEREIDAVIAAANESGARIG